MCDADHQQDPSEYRVVGISHCFADDPSLLTLEDLAANWEALRSSVSAPWRRTRIPEDELL